MFLENAHRPLAGVHLLPQPFVQWAEVLLLTVPSRLQSVVRVTQQVVQEPVRSLLTVSGMQTENRTF